MTVAPDAEEVGDTDPQLAAEQVTVQSNPPPRG
jgi:hypothetical protein